MFMIYFQLSVFVFGGLGRARVPSIYSVAKLIPNSKSVQVSENAVQLLVGWFLDHRFDVPDTACLEVSFYLRIKFVVAGIKNCRSRFQI